MTEREWKFFAIATCVVAGLGALAVPAFIALLVNESGGPIFAIVAFGLILPTTARPALAVGSWFWPEQCNQDWLIRNPPLFHFYRCRPPRAESPSTAELRRD